MHHRAAIVPWQKLSWQIKALLLLLSPPSFSLSLSHSSIPPHSHDSPPSRTMFLPSLSSTTHSFLPLPLSLSMASLSLYPSLLTSLSPLISYLSLSLSSPGSLYSLPLHPILFLPLSTPTSLPSFPCFLSLSFPIYLSSLSPPARTESSCNPSIRSSAGSLGHLSVVNPWPVQVGNAGTVLAHLAVS